MKIIIAGGRDFIPEDRHIIFLENIYDINHIEEVVSGCAKGADLFGEVWAEDKKITIKRFPADWKKYGKRAGILRNIQMAEYSDALCAFWDGKSKGTKHMIDEAHRRGLSIYVSNYGD
jgi:hypothetical protein